MAKRNSGDELSLKVACNGGLGLDKSFGILLWSPALALTAILMVNGFGNALDF
jgi:hypothetical protein